MGIQDAKQAATAAPPAGEPTAAVATVDAPPVPNFYCLGPQHAARLVTVERFFYFAGEVHPPGHPQAGELILVDQVPGRDPMPDLSKCPVCPVCSAKEAGSPDPLTGRPREVRLSSVPLEYDGTGNPQIPQAILDIAQRAGEA